jgi:hypothetical protein
MSSVTSCGRLIMATCELGSQYCALVAEMLLAAEMPDEADTALYQSDRLTGATTSDLPGPCAA